MAEESKQWRANLRAMRDQVRLRLRSGELRPRFVRGGSLRGKTGIVVARVFKGNVIFKRLKLARKPWVEEKKKKFLDLFPGFQKFLASFPAAALVFGGPAHAEALDHQNGTSTTFFRELAEKKRLLKGRVATLDEELKKKISEHSPAVRLLRAIAVPVLGNVCHVFMHGLNRTEVYGLEKLQNAVLHRVDRQGLVTVSNHVAAMDDPLVTASLLSPQMLLDGKILRWTLCATDRCFTSVAKSVLFTSLKVLPVSRGQGIHQEGMDLALEKLNHGDWVHIFPEGSRSRDGGKTLGQAKRGVGRLVLEAEKTPLIIPFIHDGMQEVLPIGSKFPHICKKVTVLVGDPIPVDDLMALRNSRELSADELYDAVAERVGETMQGMKSELDKLVAEEKVELEKNRKLYLARRASGIWEHVDWEMEGFPVEELVERRYNTLISEDPQSSEAITLPQPEMEPEVDPESEPEDRVWFPNVDMRSMTSRLRSYGDPAVFMSFAAKGLSSSCHIGYDSLGFPF